MTTTTTT